LPDAVRVLDPFHVVRLALAALDDVRRRVQHIQTGHRCRTGDPLYGIRRVLRRRADHLSTKARARLETGLIAGDPTGEVTIAWTVVQQVMDLYRGDDPDQARAPAAELIAALRECPIDELARLGRTLHAWRDELLTHFAQPEVSNGPTESLSLKNQEHEADRPRIPQPSLITDCDYCSTTAASTRSCTATNQNAPSQVRCVEPVMATEPWWWHQPQSRLTDISAGRAAR
jgi:hypothetical protein